MDPGVSESFHEVLRTSTANQQRAAEVAFQLLGIFLLFGAPHILQSDNGAEFTASIITELKQIWPELVIVRGKRRNPQSQSSVERLSCDVKDILITCLSDNKTCNWSVGLKFVQFYKNPSWPTWSVAIPSLVWYNSKNWVLHPVIFILIS